MKVFNVRIQSRRDALGSPRGAKKINNAYREEVSGRRGRPNKSIDRTLDGIWWVLCTGAMWNQLPGRFGKHNSVWRCFRRWCESGMWTWILERISGRYRDFSISVMLDASHVKAHQDASKHPLALEDQKLGKTKGGCNTKISAAVNVVGLPLSMRLVCGNEHDSISVVDTIRGLVNGSFLLADKAYDSDAIRCYVQDCGGIAVIPPRRNRKRKVEYLKEVGKTRHRVENFFAKIKRYRRIGTRYDKLEKTYMGFVNVAALVDWVKFDFVHAA